MLFRFPERDLDNFLLLGSSIHRLRNFAGFFAQSPDVIVKCAYRDSVFYAVRGKVILQPQGKEFFT